MHYSHHYFIEIELIKQANDHWHILQWSITCLAINEGDTERSDHYMNTPDYCFTGIYSWQCWRKIEIIANADHIYK